MSRRGVALLIAVVVLGLVTAMVATALELALVEHRSGAGQLAAARARGAAESALAEAAGGWDPSLRPAGPGSSIPLSSRLLLPGLLAELRIHGTEGPYLLLTGLGVLAAAGGGELARAEVHQVVRPAALPGDSLERPVPVRGGWWRYPP